MAHASRQMQWLLQRAKRACVVLTANNTQGSGTGVHAGTILAAGAAATAAVLTAGAVQCRRSDKERYPTLYEYETDPDRIAACECVIVCAFDIIAYMLLV